MQIHLWKLLFGTRGQTRLDPAGCEPLSSLRLESRSDDLFIIDDPCFSSINVLLPRLLAVLYTASLPSLASSLYIALYSQTSVHCTVLLLKDRFCLLPRLLAIVRR